jgi:hypothetical protein
MSQSAIKVCSTCQEPKDREQGFYKNRRAADGRANECKSCQHDRNVQPSRRAALRESSAKSRASRASRTIKVCSRCQEPKDRDRDFHKNRSTWDGRQSECKKCQYDRDVQRRKLKPRPYTSASAASSARHRTGLRVQVLGHYGERCACCGSTENLGIDHVNGDGQDHRFELTGRRRAAASTAQVYRWLIRNGFPEGFQTLCLPCNASKAQTGWCRLLHSIDCPSCGHRLTREEILAAAAELL